LGGALGTKSRRVRCPVHNLIEFGGPGERDQRQLEQALWQVIETAPFQRLRRIKQLGFSELVFLGATHTRFAHSVGVFHVARQLVGAIRRSVADTNEQQIRVALAAALVHDVGHGMFSHAFERFGTHFNLAMARHEIVSAALIRSREIGAVLTERMGRGFADEVADMVVAKQPANLYASVVSSQFDADRLDYMQRDRMMTGVRSSDVDAAWLISNLEVGPVNTGSEDGQTGTVDTLILGQKARQTAESYVVSVLHLYQNVYGHRATRGAETAFFALMCQLSHLCREGRIAHTGLPVTHPLIRFMTAPEELDHALALDDTVFWGAASQLCDAGDQPLRQLAARLHTRRLPKVVDIRLAVEARFPAAARENPRARTDRLARIGLVCTNVVSALDEWQAGTQMGERAVITDRYDRSPYRQFDTGQTPMNQMHIRVAGGQVLDMASVSAVVAGAEPFSLCRAYVFRDDADSMAMIGRVMDDEVGRAAGGHA
jgi:uncharacterized protein